MKRNDFLDVLKGICILLVILTHFDWTEPERLKYLFPFWMNPAVPVFMIISGYLFAESFKRKNVTKFREAYNLKQIINKIIRYTIPLILIYGIEVVLKIYVAKQELSASKIFTTFFLGGFGPGSYYYPYMIQFIFLFPLIYFAIRKWNFGGLVACGAANVIYEVLKVPLHMTASTYRLIVLRYIFAIAIGCYISLGKKKMPVWLGILSMIFGAGFIYAVCYTDYRPTYFFRWARTSMLAVFYIAPIAYVLIKNCTWSFKPLAMLGKASYNIFFVQMVVFHVFKAITKHGIEGTWLPMLATYAACIGLGLVFYLLETPVTKAVVKVNERVFERKNKLNFGR